MYTPQWLNYLMLAGFVVIYFTVMFALIYWEYWLKKKYNR